MANNFKNINYGRLLYEALRNYFSVNTVGDLSILYKYLAGIIQPLQPPFEHYVTFREREALIASCKWQIGQLTNVLNFLYDNNLKRIYITQSVLSAISDPTFDYSPINFDGDFAHDPLIYERGFFDHANQSIVTINVPSSVSPNISDLIATVNQIRLQGIPYQINIF